jgi:hypothetical protein
MNEHLRLDRARRRPAALARDVAIPVPFELSVFGACLQRRVGGVIELLPAAMPSGAPSGTLLKTGRTSFLCYERDTSPLHQAHIVLSLAAQLLHGEAGPLIDRRLVPDLDPQLIRLMLGDAQGSALPQADAEMFAFLVLERAGAVALPSGPARRAFRWLAPLRSVLCAAVPEAASVLPDTRHGARFQLYRRVIEIRDAALALGPYRDPEVASAAAQAAFTAGYSGIGHAAMVEAAVLAAAARTWDAGRPVRRPAGRRGRGPALSLDLRSEADWLVAVSRAFAWLCQDGQAIRRRRSSESARRCGALDGRSRPAAPSNACSLY